MGEDGESSDNNTAQAIQSSMRRYMTKESGKAPMAPLTNQESTTPLQETKNRNLQTTPEKGTKK